MAPHWLQVRLVFLAGTSTKVRPYRRHLYSSLERIPYQPWKRMERLRPALALALVPGLSAVSLAERVMLAMRLSSMVTSWHCLTNWVVNLCWKPCCESWRFCSTRRSCASIRR